MPRRKVVNHKTPAKLSRGRSHTPSNVITVDGDIFSLTKERIHAGRYGSSVIIPHVCNNVGAFGAGFAGAVRNTYPEVATNFELLGRPRLGYVQFIPVLREPSYEYRLVFANMIAQNKTISQANPRPLNYEALVTCMANVRESVLKSGFDKVEFHCPKFGSGLAGGDWSLIELLIEDIWKDFKVVVYNPPKAKK